MRYKVAIFDMDGTILDTLEDLADTMNYCLKQFQMPERSLDEVRKFVGNGIHKLIERAVVENTSEKIIEDVFRCFQDYYKDHCAIKTKPYNGICEVILQLRERGIHTAVVSNKADFAVKSLCVDYFDGLFEYSVGDKEGKRRKPYPDGINEVIDYFKVQREEIIYIGDSEVDYQTALNANVDSIIVGWGFREEAYLHSIGVEKVVFHPNDILSMME